MFTENLKLYRARAGLSQKEVAERLFMAQNSYSKYELGKSSPNPETLKKLAEIFGCSVANLVDESEREPIPADGLIPQEIELIERYRRLGLDKQMSLIQKLNELEKEKP